VSSKLIAHRGNEESKTENFGNESKPVFPGVIQRNPTHAAFRTGILSLSSSLMQHIATNKAGSQPSAQERRAKVCARFSQNVRCHVKQAVVMLMLLIANVSHADRQKFFGVWQAGDKAGLAIYPVLMITKDHISWPNSANRQRCTAGYRITSTSIAATYPDQWLAPGAAEKLPPDNYEIVSIEVIPNKCSPRIALQFAFPRDVPDYVEVNMYECCSGIPNNTTLHYAGGMSFQREK
jgi:hypothetical protein